LGFEFSPLGRVCQCLKKERFSNELYWITPIGRGKKHQRGTGSNFSLDSVTEEARRNGLLVTGTGRDTPIEKGGWKV